MPRLGPPHPISADVLRHTAITAVGRLAGYPAAQTFAGHTPPTVTGHYLHATPTEVATTIATLTGEPHPSSPPRPGQDGPPGGQAATTR